MRVLLRSAEGEGFVPPSSKDFQLPPIFGDNVYTTKPILLVFFTEPFAGFRLCNCMFTIFELARNV